jgi:hypothetical protein
VDVDMNSGRASGSFSRLTRGPDDTTPVLFPDDSQVAYGFVDPDAEGVAMLDLHSGTSRRVLTHPRAAAPAASVFAARSREDLLLYGATATSPAIAALSVGSGAVRPVAPGSTVGRNFVYVAQTGEVLYAADNADPPPAGIVLNARSLVTGVERVVATVDYLKDFLVSPDGRYIAYNRYLSAVVPGPQTRTPGGEIGLMTLDGKPERRLRVRPRGSFSPTLGAWSPDGRFLLFFDAYATPRVIKIETLESWVLLKAPNQPGWYYKQAAWAHDGSFLVMPGVNVSMNASTPQTGGRRP